MDIQLFVVSYFFYSVRSLLLITFFNPLFPLLTSKSLQRSQKKKKRTNATIICISNAKKTRSKIRHTYTKNGEKSTSLDFNRKSTAKTKDKGIFCSRLGFFSRCHSECMQCLANMLSWEYCNILTQRFESIKSNFACFCFVISSSKQKNTTIWSM